MKLHLFLAGEANNCRRDSKVAEEESTPTKQVRKHGLNLEKFKHPFETIQPLRPLTNSLKSISGEDTYEKVTLFFKNVNKRSHS